MSMRTMITTMMKIMTIMRINFERNLNLAGSFQIAIFSWPKDKDVQVLPR